MIVQVLFTFCYWLKWDVTVPLDFTATVFKFFYIISVRGYIQFLETIGISAK